MNVFIHDMEADIKLGDTMRNPAFISNTGSLQQFSLVTANPMWNQKFKQEIYENDPYNRFNYGYPPTSSADWGWVQHIHASLNDNGRAAIVLDTGAASRGSGSANVTKEKQERKWFVDNDLIEGVIYLPDNLFYNTTAPGIILFLNKNKSKAQKNKIFLLNAGREFEKGDPKNYITDEGITRIAETFAEWREEDKFSRIITREEIIKNDYNISPSRYIHISETEDSRPIAEILDDLKTLESEIQDNALVLNSIFVKLGIV